MLSTLDRHSTRCIRLFYQGFMKVLGFYKLTYIIHVIQFISKYNKRSDDCCVVYNNNIILCMLQVVILPRFHLDFTIFFIVYRYSWLGRYTQLYVNTTNS